jgi:gliding motility-associated-like protein
MEMDRAIKSMAWGMKKLTLIFLLGISLAAQAQITSTFDSDADGWTFLNNGTPVTVNHNSSNGNPGGFVSTAPYASNTTATSQGWFAPAKFLGPQALRSYGMNLRFDLQQAFAGTASSGQGDVRIQTSGGFDIVFSLPVKPAVAPAWSSYTIKLDETGGWKVASTGGAAATKADVIRALSDIQILEIRGTYVTNAANVVGIDNVILEQKILGIAPAVTSFSPLSGIPGASVTINGNNFGATAAQNAVFFGTTKATITSGNATQLVVTIPAGAQFGPITVINLTTGLSVQSNQSFSPLFDNNKDFGGRIIPSSLDLKDDINLPAGNGQITGLDLGDLDGDGLVDIIATEIKSSPTVYQELLVFRNLGVTGDINASSFGPRTVLGQSAEDCSVVDLDGDGRLDIVGHYSAASVNYFITYRNISTAGNIAFEAPESFVDFGQVGDLHVADLDGDGRPDLMGTHPSLGLFFYFYIAQNLSVPGDILFGSVTAPDPVIAGATGISTGDLTGDGKLDIVVSNNAAFRIFHNQSTPGTIALAAPVLIDPTNNVTNVEIADLDNDGKLDLSWASGVAASAIRIRKNIYSGGVLDGSSFDPEVVITSPLFAPDRLTVADINGDDKLDMVTTNVTNLGIFENVSSGVLNASSFRAPVQFQGTTFNTNPLKPVVADLDGDNKPDVVTATAGSSSSLQIFIFRNTSFPAPVISSITPTTGAAGTSVTVSGNFMNTNAATPIVKFGSTPATTGSVSNTSLTTAIPVGATSDKVSVALHGLTAFSKPLNITFPTSRTINAASFTAPIEFALTNAFVDFTVAADNLSVADFDNDGKTDVVVNDNGTFRIFRNTVASNGSAISTASLTSIATTYTSVAHLTTSDIDGDGKTDLFANAFMYRNNSGTTADAISFEPGVQHIVSGTTGIVANHDFNHDGKSDIAHTGGNLYQVDENASRKGAFTFVGGGVFSTIVNSSISAGAGGQPEKIIADDFDGDGYDDLAFGVNAGADFLSVVRNTGLNQPLAPAQFAPALTFPALDLPWSIASADFDGDGKTDIVLGNNNAAFISIYKNTSTVGSISFLAKQDIAALTRAIEVKAVDLDGDGKPEIVVAHKPTTTTGSFTVFQNTSTSGTISFSAGINYALTRGPLSLAIADINLDAKPDLIFTANGTTTDALLVFENKILSIPPPTITSFTPTSGPVGTTVTITGTNFGTTTAGNIVYFGAVQATVTAATSTQLTVTVPTGATFKPITVAVNGLTVYTSRPFVVSFAGGGPIDNCSFAPSVNIGTVSSSFSPAIPGDLDGDGKMDLSVPERFNNQLAIFRNTSVSGTASFAPKLTFTGLTEALATAVGDLDSDGKPDIAVVNYTNGQLSVYKNLSTPGNISVATRITYTIPAFSHDVSIADIDGDGKQDLIITASIQGLIVMRNQGSPGVIDATTFAAGVTFATGANAYPFALGDIDGDGKLDAVVPNANTYTLSVLRNTSTPGIVSFAVPVTLTTNTGTPTAGFGAGYTALGDVDGDTKLDLVAVSNTVTKISLFRNISTPGSITFDPRFDIATTGIMSVPSFSDLNGDGKVELVTDNGPLQMLVFENTATLGAINASSFKAPIVISRTSSSTPQLADVDGDGRNDIISTSTTMQVFQNLIGTISPPTITSFSPSVGIVGSSVTVTGTNFSSLFSRTVEFNGTPATITASTATTLTVTVPVGATTGPIRVTIGCNITTGGNFTVGSPATITITTQPSHSAVCIGATTTFTTAATGTTNITYQWQFSPTLAGTYNDIANGSGYSNVTTSTLSVNTTESFGAGFYRCQVNGDFAATVFTNAAQLTIHAIPNAPTVTGASNCGTGSVVLGANGGADGLYRWYTVATGGIADAQVNSAFTTPILTSTTDYFVSINNGSCESTRTQVTATVTTTPAPTTTGTSACAGNTFTLTASGGTNGQYKWYTVATGGSAIVGEVNNSYTSPALNSTTNYFVSITIGTCESTRTQVTATIITTGCTPVITPTPLATQVEGKIIVDLKPLITTVGTLDANSIKVIVQPKLSGATASIANGILTIDYSGKTFSGNETIRIEACNTLGACSQTDFEIKVDGEIVVYNALSANDDILNATFHIQNIGALPETKTNRVVIFNRWGDVVFDVENYDNTTKVFRGLSNDGKELPSGIYFYKVTFSSGAKALEGFISLKR